MAKQHDPVVAERMNALPKAVFFRTLEKAFWKNTRLVKSDLEGEIQKMKKESGDGMVILGSGSIVSQAATEALIDEYVVFGKGRTMFEGLKDTLRLKLTKSRIFGNGNVFLCYGPHA